MSVPPETSPVPSSSNALAGKRVLVVEDVWIVAQSYVALLEQLGVIVCGPAGTVSEAMGLIETQPVDAALVDLNLNGEMAISVVETLAGRGVPVVIVTGYDVAPELAAKAAACLSKPVRAEALLKAFREL